jgi:hypothetical protein
LLRDRLPKKSWDVFIAKKINQKPFFKFQKEKFLTQIAILKGSYTFAAVFGQFFLDEDFWMTPHSHLT